MGKYVKRDDVYEFAKDQLIKETGAYSKGLNDGLKIMMSAARNKDAIASADVRPVVHGKWEDFDDDYSVYDCSVCGERAPDDFQWNFCPNCGADMGRMSDGRTD